jgi:hypothetical protein
VSGCLPDERGVLADHEGAKCIPQFEPERLGTLFYVRDPGREHAPEARSSPARIALLVTVMKTGTLCP